MCMRFVFAFNQFSGYTGKKISNVSKVTKNEKRKLQIDLQITVKRCCILFGNICLKHLRSLIVVLLVLLRII